MRLGPSLLAFLFAVSLVQGAFLAPVVAMANHVNRRAVRVLALIILCFLPMIGEELVGAAGLARRFPHTIGSSITIDFLIAPLLFFYSSALIEPNRSFTRRDAFHFVPFALATLALVPFAILSGSEKLAVLQSGLPLSFRLIIVAKIGVAATYLTIILRRVHRFMATPDNPRARDPHVVWFRRTMISLAVVAVGSAALGALSAYGFPLPIDTDTIDTLFICACIFQVSALLIRHPLSVMAVDATPLAQFIVSAPLRRKYETSPLDENQKQEYLERLVRHMADAKPYLDMSLSLEKLADALGVRASHLSQVLNERRSMNFYEFLNGYRVREAQARIVDPKQAEKTLIAIAHESGFNSKASFNRAFKRFTGQTPSEYARSMEPKAAGTAAE